MHGEAQRHDNASFRNTIALIRSDDGGATFSGPAQRALMGQDSSSGANAGMDGVVVLPDGSVAVLHIHMTLASAPSGGKSATGKPTVVRDARRISHEMDDPDALTPLAVDALIVGMLAAAIRSLPAGRRPGALPRWLSRTRELLHEQFRERLTFVDIAATAGVHPSHLARECVRLLGVGPGRYRRTRGVDSEV